MKFSLESGRWKKKERRFRDAISRRCAEGVSVLCLYLEEAVHITNTNQKTNHL